MKARIIKCGISRMEGGVRKEFGDTVEITKDELKSGGYAPLKINVKPKARVDVKPITDKGDAPHGDVEKKDRKKA